MTSGFRILIVTFLTFGFFQAQAVPSLKAVPFKSPTPKRNNPFKVTKIKCADDEDGSLETSPQDPLPGIDDPGVTGCRQWEVNLTFDSELAKNPDGSQTNSYTLPVVELAYGISPNWELTLTVPKVIVSNASTDLSEDGIASTSKQTARGMGKVEIGAKWNPYNNDDTGTSIAFGPRVEFNPNGNHSHAVQSGLAEPGSVVSIPIFIGQRIASTKNGDVNMTVNAGYNKVFGSDTSNSVTAGAGVGFPITAKWAGLISMDGERALHKDENGNRETLVRVNVGFIHPLNKKWTVYGVMGRGKTNDGTRVKNFALMFKTNLGQ